MSDEKKPEEDKTTEEKPVEEVKIETSKKDIILKSLKSKKVLIILGIVVLIIIAIAGFFIFKAKSSKATSTTEQSDKPGEPAKQVTTYFDLDEFIVNLDKGEGHPNFLKLTVTLQLPGQAMVEKVRAKLPIIRDAFQVYLRELRSDDLQGSAGIYRLKEELLLRVQYIMAPDKIDDILFKEMLVQ